MALWPAVVVALVGIRTGTLVSYAIQLSEYQIDAACVVAVVLLHHEIIWDVEQPRLQSTRVLLAYGGIALTCFFSTPIVFIAGPLLLLDAVRSLRRPLGQRFVGAVAAGIVILVQLAAFVAAPELAPREYVLGSAVPAAQRAGRASLVRGRSAARLCHWRLRQIRPSRTCRAWWSGRSGPGP